MRYPKTNTDIYTKNLEIALNEYKDTFVYVKPTKKAKYEDYIVHLETINHLDIIKNLFRGVHYHIATRYSLNPFIIHPDTMNKLKTINTDFVVYYMIFEDKISSSFWDIAEKNINKKIEDLPNRWILFDNPNMYFKMEDEHIGLFKVDPALRTKLSVLSDVLDATILFNFSIPRSGTTNDNNR